MNRDPELNCAVYGHVLIFKILHEEYTYYALYVHIYIY